MNNQPQDTHIYTQQNIDESKWGRESMFTHGHTKNDAILLICYRIINPNIILMAANMKNKINC